MDVQQLVVPRSPSSNSWHHPGFVLLVFYYMIILLDIDGVLVTTPAWRPVELLSDGFMKFNETAAANLARLVSATNAAIVLTTTHRISYSVAEWHILLKTRGIRPSGVSKVNEATTVSAMANRAAEIEEWVNKNGAKTNYVVIDDDLSLHGLPESIKSRCVLTKPMLGLNNEAAEQVLSIVKPTEGW